MLLLALRVCLCLTHHLQNCTVAGTGGRIVMETGTVVGAGTATSIVAGAGTVVGTVAAAVVDARAGTGVVVVSTCAGTGVAGIVSLTLVLPLVLLALLLELSSTPIPCHVKRTYTILLAFYTVSGALFWQLGVCMCIYSQHHSLLCLSCPCAYLDMRHIDVRDPVQRGTYFHHVPGHDGSPRNTTSHRVK